MWIFTKQLDALEGRDLDGLAGGQYAEGQTLEFKRSMYGRSDEAIREMLRDITSLANSESGVLIIGLAEDDEGRGMAWVDVPDADTEATRIVDSCLANVSERIPGLRSRAISVAGGRCIVIVVPRSYRRPHMISFRGSGTDFWVRHDRQKSRMSIAEIRAALTATEDLTMRAESYLQTRREVWQVRTGPILQIAATPFILEDGRIDITDPRWATLLHGPPELREAGVKPVGLERRVDPTIRGLAAVSEPPCRLELFRTGHLEFVLLDVTRFGKPAIGERRPEIEGWTIVEYLWNFSAALRAIREIAAISDPYLFGLSVWSGAGYGFREAGRDRFGIAELRTWNEGNHINLEPIVVNQDELPDVTARRISDRFWNAFGFMQCRYFDADGHIALT